MEFTFSSLCYLISLATLTSGLVPTLVLMPELNHLWILKGSVLELRCIYTQPNDTNSPGVDFYFDTLCSMIVEDGLHGFSIQTLAVDDNAGGRITTLTLNKNITAPVDAGTYVCRSANGFLEALISVHYFEVKLVGDILSWDDQYLTLHCDPEAFSQDLPPITVLWSHYDKTIANDSEKYNITGTSLVINNAERSDMGVYHCQFVIAPGYIEVGYRTQLQTVEVLAPPQVDAHALDRIFVEHERLELWCNVSGYPFPAINWTINGTLAIGRERIQLAEHNGSPNGKLIITSMETEDKGRYTCEACSGALNSCNEASIGVFDEVPIAIIYEVSNGVIRQEKWAKFWCEAHGFPISDIKWLKDGHAIKGEGEGSRVWMTSGTVFSKIIINQLLPEDYGQYWCVTSASTSSVNNSERAVIVTAEGAMLKEHKTSSSREMNAGLIAVATGLVFSKFL